MAAVKHWHSDSSLEPKTARVSSPTLSPPPVKVNYRRTKRFLSTVVSRKYAPPFATLALIQSAVGGGLIRGTRDIFFRNYALGECLAILWMRRTRGGEMLPTLVVGWRLQR